MGVATGTFQYPNGSPVASGLYQWKLSSDAIEFSGTSACIVPPVVRGNLDSSGNLTTTFAFNDVLSTTAGAVTTYQLTVKDIGGGQVWNENYYLTGTAANLNLIAPGGSGPPQIVVTSTATTILLQTNGVTNAVQTVENLVAGTNVTLTNTAGATTINASTGGAVIPTGQGWFLNSIQPWMVSLSQGSSYSLSAVSSWPGNSASTVFCVLIQNPIQFTTTALQYQITNTSTATGVFGAIGLFTPDGNTKLIDSGTQNLNSSLPVGSVSVTYAATALTPGCYWLAFSNNSVLIEQGNGGVGFLGLGSGVFGGTGVGSTVFSLLNLDTVRVGYGAVTATGGAMPATLGSITVASFIGGNSHVFQGMPMILFR